MEYLLNVYKRIGLTPFQLIQEFKKKFRQYKDIPISHAGKLDPLAEGVMFLVCGKEIKNLKKYMGVDKTYKAKILFGLSSDSYDIQGIGTKNNRTIDTEKLKKEIESLRGEYLQELPVFSGRIVNKKPLFYWARTNQLDKIEIPKEKVMIYDINLNKISKINSNEVLKEINYKINLLNGDFRQKEIIETWNKILEKNNEDFIVADVTINCSSGTYIRSIANDLGKRMGTYAILLNLIRTRVDKFNIKDSIRV